LSGTDPDGDSLTFFVTVPPNHGSLSGVPPDLLYTPHVDYLGPDVLEFIADDGLLASEPARVEIVVDRLNEPPVAEGQEAVTQEDQSVAIELAGSDPDGDPLTFTLVTSPTNGTLTGTPPSLSYSPNADFTGSDGFIFAAGDGRATASAAVDITVTPVNDAPVATATSLATVLDASMAFTLGATDPDGDALTFTLVSLPASGTLSGDPPTMTYTPSPAFSGVDTFEFSVSDAEFTSAPAAVTISVNIPNRPPVAGPQSVTTDEDSALPITLTGSDPDGDALTYAITVPPSFGILTGNAPNLTYVPTSGFSGTDQFSFTVSDGTLVSNAGIVTITVDPLPGGPAPLTAWVGVQGGVSVDAHHVTFSGASTTWTNTVRSVPVSTLGLMTPYEVFFTLETSPATALWVVGLGVTDSGPSWTDIDYGLRNSNGTLQIYENGTFRANAGALAQGDVISIMVTPGAAEYRRNGVFVYRRTYAGSPDFYVDTAFKQGAASLSVSVAGNASSPPPDLPISSWQGTAGGVTSAGSDVSYSGSPTGWSNTIRTAPLTSLGAGTNFSVRWTVGPNPAGSLWIAGLGITESGATWTDVDYGLRNSNGALKVYENGTLVKGAGTLAAGDVLSIRVAGTVLEYRRNDELIISRSISPGAAFYIDTSFKEGAAQLTGFTLSNSLN
jgi:hypothetical protein